MVTLKSHTEWAVCFLCVATNHGLAPSWGQSAQPDGGCGGGDSVNRSLEFGVRSEGRWGSNPKSSLHRKSKPSKIVCKTIFCLFSLPHFLTISTSFPRRLALPKPGSSDPHWRSYVVKSCAKCGDSSFMDLKASPCERNLATLSRHKTQNI